jgi:hypothetical protein
MQACRECGGELEPGFRYCPWCAAPQRRKLVQFFSAHPGIEGDRGKALRVSRYFGDERHVRFSIWNPTGRAEAAVSLSEDETQRLASFVGRHEPARRRGLLSSLKVR